MKNLLTLFVGMGTLGSLCKGTSYLDRFLMPFQPPFTPVYSLSCRPGGFLQMDFLLEDGLEKLA